LNHSIWKEQIDIALLNLIRNSITITNLAGGEKFSLDGDSVFIRKPENEFQITIYPGISIYSLYDTYNPERTIGSTREIVNRDYENKKITINPTRQKFTLTYQIDFWAKKQLHMNDMTLQWLTKFTRYYNLELQDMSGEACNILMLQRWGEGMKKEDLIDGKERIFHSFITYDFWAEIDQGSVELPMVTDMVIDQRQLDEMPIKRGV
jgi:hypothetical protein